MDYAATALTGVAITAALLAWLLRDEAVHWGNVAAMLLCFVFAGLLGAKVFYVVERGGVVWHDLAFEFRSGYRYPGGIIGVVLALPVVWRWFHPGVALARFADAWAPSLPFILALDRMSRDQPDSRNPLTPFLRGNSSMS